MATIIGAAAGSGGGSGDVVGPGSSTDNAIARFDGTGGKTIQNSVNTIADTTGNTVSPGIYHVKSTQNFVTMTGALLQFGSLPYQLSWNFSNQEFVFDDGATGSANIAFAAGNIRSSTATFKFTEGADTGSLVAPALTAARTWTLPDATGTVALLANPASFTTLTSTGNTTLGDAAGDALTINPAAPTMPNIADEADDNNIFALLVWETGGLIKRASAQTVSDWMAALCPFVDILVDGERIRVGEAIPNRNSTEKRGVDLLALPVLVSYVEISEEKDEVSYISRIELKVSLLGGGVVTLPAVGHEFPLVLEKGDRRAFAFGDLPANAVSAALLSEGYYIPNPKGTAATDLPQKEGK